LEVAVSEPVRAERRAAELSKVYTPETKTIEQVSAFLNLPPSSLMKSLIFIADRKPVMVLVRGDYEVSEAKLEIVLGGPFRPAGPDEVLRLTGAHVGFVGPIGLKHVEIIADEGLKGQHNLTTGANEDDHHRTGIEVGRDFEVSRYADIRAAAPGDACATCGGTLTFGTAIEVGHIFKLGTRYAEAIGATFSDVEGKECPIVMGSYGIGIERIVASVIEQDADEDGIVWPVTIAPFHVHVLPVDVSDPDTMEVAERLYEGIEKRGYEVLMDDREERAGVKFKDADLLGLPVRITIGRRALKEGQIEIKPRRSASVFRVPKEEGVDRTLRMIRDMEQELAL